MAAPCGLFMNTNPTPVGIYTVYSLEESIITVAMDGVEQEP
jgi:hypothetical protein